MVARSVWLQGGEVWLQGGDLTLSGHNATLPGGTVRPQRQGNKYISQAGKMKFSLSRDRESQERNG